MSQKAPITAENRITHDDFQSISRRVHYNAELAGFYERFAGENKIPFAMKDGEIVYGDDQKFLRRSKAMKSCCSVMDIDHYPQQGVKHLVRMDRCRDRFCLNCQALEADQRYAQYAPILDGYTKKYDLYHVVLTVPNVDAEFLADTVTLMLDRFSYLIRYFDGRKRIQNVDFKRYGYVGAVRGLEITISKKNGSYHPHLHCIFILKKDLDLPQVYWNRFSADNQPNPKKRKPLRLFSELELLIQRIWCLLILRIEVTKYNIEHIEEVSPYPDGFSCMAEVTNGDYHEIFKYAIKGSFQEKTLFKYEVFLNLYKALFGRRCYATYGVLRNCDFNEIDSELGLFTPDAAFDLFIAHLQLKEAPRRIRELLNEIVQKTKNDAGDVYFSKAVYARHFKALSEEDKVSVLKALTEHETGVATLCKSDNGTP